MPGTDHVLSKGFLATGGSVAYPQWSVVQQVAAVGVVPAAVALAPTSLGVAAAAAPLGVSVDALDAVKTVTGKAFINIALDERQVHLGRYDRWYYAVGDRWYRTCARRARRGVGYGRWQGEVHSRYGAVPRLGRDR